MANQVMLPLMDLFRANIGKSYSSAELAACIGPGIGKPSVTAAIRALRKRGWKIDRVTGKYLYLCTAVGSASEQAAPMGLSVDCSKVDLTVPGNYPVVPFLAPGKQPETSGLVPGDLMEVLHVSRSGTILLEDSEGHQYTAKAVG